MSTFLPSGRRTWSGNRTLQPLVSCPGLGLERGETICTFKKITSPPEYALCRLDEGDGEMWKKKGKRRRDKVREV